ncbi:unnamed protein product, partial [Coregonus sp. 'balchen']
ALIDVAKHLGNLKFRVWEKIVRRLGHRQPRALYMFYAYVLDSEGFSSGKHSWKAEVGDHLRWTPVILDPNTAHACLSLSDDLTSMRRLGQRQQLPDNPERCMFYADVLGSEGFSLEKHNWEVGTHPYSFLGVAKESINRKVEINRKPRFGIWEIGQIWIRVQLDHNRGEVFFYDTKDMTLIFTHKDWFPFCWTGW